MPLDRPKAVFHPGQQGRDVPPIVRIKLRAAEHEACGLQGALLILIRSVAVHVLVVAGPLVVHDRIRQNPLPQQVPLCRIGSVSYLSQADQLIEEDDRGDDVGGVRTERRPGLEIDAKRQRRGLGVAFDHVGGDGPGNSPRRLQILLFSRQLIELDVRRAYAADLVRLARLVGVLAVGGVVLRAGDVGPGPVRGRVIVQDAVENQANAGDRPLVAAIGVIAGQGFHAPVGMASLAVLVAMNSPCSVSLEVTRYQGSSPNLVRVVGQCSM